jgi:hypothetical protein
MKRGMVVASFALRAPDQEPNPCNIRIAEAARRIVNEEYGNVVIVSQWEVTKRLSRYWNSLIARNVELKSDDSYLGAEDVWEAAKKEFRERDITEVIIVSQLLVRLKLNGLAKKDGFKVINRGVGWIGFDRSPENTQPWTKGPIRLLVYAVRQVLFGARGPATNK